MTARHRGNRHNQTGRSTSVPADTRMRQVLGPPQGEAFTWYTREMMESAAFRSLSRAALQCLHRIMIEHMAHAGRENGALVVTYENFADYGARRSSIAKAIRELEAAGFLAETLRGGLAFGIAKMPSRYRLTWIGDRDGKRATDEWRRKSEEFPQTRKRA